MKPIVSIVTNLDDYQAYVSVRAAAFIAKGEPYNQEFDSNDLVCATHLLARQNNEPVGALRIRIMSTLNGGIAAWERLAILPVEGRGIRVLMSLADYATEYSLFKGCHRVVGGVENDTLMNFWKRRGFKETGNPPVNYNDKLYTEIGCDMSPDKHYADPHGQKYSDASIAEAAYFDQITAEGGMPLPQKVVSLM